MLVQLNDRRDRFNVWVIEESLLTGHGKCGLNKAMEEAKTS